MRLLNSYTFKVSNHYQLALKKVLHFTQYSNPK